MVLLRERLNNMRVGLERANSCHDHDGFRASPHQLLSVTQVVEFSMNF